MTLPSLPPLMQGTSAYTLSSCGSRSSSCVTLPYLSTLAGYIRVHPQQLRVQEQQLDVPVTDTTTARQVIEHCLRQLGLSGPDDYTLSEVLIDRNGEHARLPSDAQGDSGTTGYRAVAAAGKYAIFVC